MGISTHILDTTRGKPAISVPVSLSRMSNGLWTLVHEAITDGDGRCKYLLPPAELLLRGMYRVHFDTAFYFEQHGEKGLYPYVEIAFIVSDDKQHYHIPLLLTVNGYTTYRGS
jgi:5-hydroxyisourate hydrolase